MVASRSSLSDWNPDKLKNSTFVFLKFYWLSHDQIFVKYCANSIIIRTGWWYGVVGHLETCDRDANRCQCQNSGESFEFHIFNGYFMLKVVDMIKIGLIEPEKTDYLNLWSLITF